MKAAIYARVSTIDQEPENQLRELRRWCQVGCQAERNGHLQRPHASEPGSTQPFANKSLRFAAALACNCPSSR